uniref:OTU domain-containing protein 6A n=1 Tax=Jaculus jaculus TaxID=51337 RepID=UPI0003333DDF|nr:OTU domain-containing protein 6A [Jaculus jaculus]
MDPHDEYQRVIRRHLLEKEELYAQIQSMKYSIPKNDKNRRKQMFLDAARHEAQMNQRHQQELEKLQDKLNYITGESITSSLAKMNQENLPPCSAKAQKRRQRTGLLQGPQERIALEETDLFSIYRLEEEEKVAAILRPKNLVMKTIPADGHCMYRAIQDQLAFSVTMETLRYHTASYMRKHMDDFLPFFSEPEGDNLYTQEDFLRYCNDIMFRSSWGGQLELRAISHILQTPIEVIQANSPIIVIGEEYHQKPLTLIYLHYACNFAEHYNSVKPIKTSPVGVRGLGPAPRLF